jgi:DNA-directed RNA polymerase subunit RPC12/RpoP
LDIDLETSYDNKNASWGFEEDMNIELKIVCRNCGYRNRKSGSAVEDRIAMNCNNCGSHIVVDAARFRTHLVNLERAVKECQIFELSVTIN